MVAVSIMIAEDSIENRQSLALFRIIDRLLDCSGDLLALALGPAGPRPVPCGGGGDKGSEQGREISRSLLGVAGVFSPPCVQGQTSEIIRTDLRDHRIRVSRIVRMGPN